MRELIVDLAHRYSRPVVIAGTGCEGVLRPPWLRHICREARGAMRLSARGASDFRPSEDAEAQRGSRAARSPIRNPSAAETRTDRNG